MPVIVHCKICDKEQSVIPARASTYRCCSYACRARLQSIERSGVNHAQWSGGERSKPCQRCGEVFHHKPPRPITVFRTQKFCSRACSRLGQKYQYGPENWKWKGGHSNRSNKQAKWARLVISRDGAQCVRCGANEVELHAHHLKPFNDHPELRWDVSNGETLCCHCHWDEHSASDENRVNSGNILTGNAEGNPEPSPGRKVREGVTVRGRAYRRWEGHCEWCNTFLSKRLSDVKGKAHHFCNKSCAMYFKRRCMTWRPAKSTAVISSKSARRESDDMTWPHGRP